MYISKYKMSPKKVPAFCSMPQKFDLLICGIEAQRMQKSDIQLKRFQS